MKTHRPPVSELDAHLGFWLRYVSNHVSGSFRKLVEAQGVSVSDWVALRQLYNAGAAAPGELMTALGMTKGAVSKIITRLQAKGLVERTTAAGDRRASTILLTSAGSRLVPVLAALADQNDAAYFGHLSTSLRTDLIAAMQQIVHMQQLKEIPVE
ncbi:MAG: MarR family transcriptional regulator [Pseudomonadota bacterium]